MKRRELSFRKKKMEDETLELLQTVCSKLIGKGEKLKRLEELGVIPDESIERRLEDLCNAGTVILNDGIEIGKADGIKIGTIKAL